MGNAILRPGADAVIGKVGAPCLFRIARA